MHPAPITDFLPEEKLYVPALDVRTNEGAAIAVRYLGVHRKSGRPLVRMPDGESLLAYWPALFKLKDDAVAAASSAL